MPPGDRYVLEYHEFDKVLGPAFGKMLYHLLADNPGWFWGHKDTDESPARSWCKGMDGLEDDPLVSALTKQARVLAEKTLNRPVQLLRTYSTALTSGLCSDLHYDDLNPDRYTFVYYPHTLTDIEGGETLFYEGDEVKQVKKPLVDTAALFDSSIMHIVRPPTNAYRGLRISVTIRLRALR